MPFDPISYNGMQRTYVRHDNPLMTDSKATKAIAFAGNALNALGIKPLQKPISPRSAYTARAASRHFLNLRSFPKPSVMIRCLTTSDG